MTEQQFLRTITVLPVHNIEEAVAWYVDKLGLELTYLHEGDHAGEATNYAVLHRDGVPIHLILDEPPPYEQTWTKAGTGYLNLHVRDVDAMHKKVQSKGAVIARGLQTENWAHEDSTYSTQAGMRSMSKAASDALYRRLRHADRFETEI